MAITFACPTTFDAPRNVQITGITVTPRSLLHG